MSKRRRLAFLSWSMDSIDESRLRLVESNNCPSTRALSLYREIRRDLEAFSQGWQKPTEIIWSTQQRFIVSP